MPTDFPHGPIANQSVERVISPHIGRKPPRISVTNRLISTVRIQIHTGHITYGIGLEESPDLGVVVAGTIVVQPCLLIEFSPGEHEQIHVVGITGGDLAVDRVLVDLGGIAVGVAQGHHAAQGIEVIVPGRVVVFHVDHGDGLIDAGAVDVLAQEVVVAVVFGDALVAVIDVLEAGLAVEGFGGPPAGGVIGVGDRVPIIGDRRIDGRHGAGPLDVVHPAAVGAVVVAAILDVLPFERVGARAGDVIGLLLPVHVAADAVLADAIEPELQVIAARFRGDLPVEGQRAGALDGRFHPGTLAVGDIAALGRIVTAVVSAGLARPACVAGGRVAEARIHCLGEKVRRRRGRPGPLEIIHPAAVGAAAAAAILDVLPHQRMLAGARHHVGFQLPIDGPTDAVLQGAIDIELQVIVVLFRRDLPVERHGARPFHGGLHLGLLIIANIAAVGRVAAVVGRRRRRCG